MICIMIRIESQEFLLFPLLQISNKDEARILLRFQER